MTTAAKMFEKLAESINQSFSKVEAYGLALSKYGWWAAGKRGRGATPRTVMDGSKLLLAILANGPADLADRTVGVESFFLDYANLRVEPQMLKEPWVRCVMKVLELPEDAGFLDFIAAFLTRYINETVDEVVFHSPEPEGFYGADVVEIPEVEVRIKGPMPAGGIRFMLSHAILNKLKSDGVNTKPLLGVKEIRFAHYFFAELAKARESGDVGSALGFAQVIRETVEHNLRGIGFERFFNSHQFASIALAFSEAAKAQEDGEK